MHIGCGDGSCVGMGIGMGIIQVMWVCVCDMNGMGNFFTLRWVRHCDGIRKEKEAVFWKEGWKDWMDRI